MINTIANTNHNLGNFDIRWSTDQDDTSGRNGCIHIGTDTWAWLHISYTKESHPDLEAFVVMVAEKYTARDDKAAIEYAVYLEERKNDPFLQTLLAEQDAICGSNPFPDEDGYVRPTGTFPWIPENYVAEERNPDFYDDMTDCYVSDYHNEQQD